MVLLYMLTPCVIIIICMLILYNLMLKKIKGDMKCLTEAIRGIQLDKSIDISLIRTVACKKFALEFLNGYRQILSLQNDKLYAEAKRKIAKQVAHDIRSPVAAINTVILALHNTSEKEINLIKNASERINQIADDLLKE